MQKKPYHCTKCPKGVMLPYEVCAKAFEDHEYHILKCNLCNCQIGCIRAKPKHNDSIIVENPPKDNKKH